MTTATSVQAIAAEALEHFETRTRYADGEKFVTLKDTRPDWLQDLVREAHGDMLPDDWRYEKIRDALEWIAESGDPEDEAGEFADNAVDVYTAARVSWLASNLNRASYVDEAVVEFGNDGGGIIDRIGLGQYAEAAEIYSSVLGSLEARANVV